MQNELKSTETSRSRQLLNLLYECFFFHLLTESCLMLFMASVASMQALSGNNSSLRSAKYLKQRWLHLNKHIFWSYQVIIQFQIRNVDHKSKDLLEEHIKVFDQCFQSGIWYWHSTEQTWNFHCRNTEKVQITMMLCDPHPIKRM